MTTSNEKILEPIQSKYKLRYLSDAQLDGLQEATLTLLETTGVKFPSEKALKVLEENGAIVDRESQIVKFPRDLVTRAMSTVPRYFNVGARDPAYNFKLEEGKTYFTTDGCGHEVIDYKTREPRASTKADVGMMAKIVDYLTSTSFYWPMVSAQDFGDTSSLHELDVSWKNTGKHIGIVTLMGEKPVEYALEMATVLAGSREALKENPIFSAVICTIAPLIQDKPAIEGAMLLAEAGIPVVLLAMPTQGSTAPATLAGSMVVGDAEVISATVLLQLVAPGAPVSHSIMHAKADPRTGGYVPYPLDHRGQYMMVEMAHHWRMSCFGGAFGTEAPEPGTWQSGAEVAFDPLLIGMAGAEWVTGIGLNRNFTLLYPEAIIFDDEIYHKARYALAEVEVSPETIALDVIDKVGPGGHYLSQKHTRDHMRATWKAGIRHQLTSDGKFRDPVEVAIEKTAWILENQQADPIEESKQKELSRILAAADKELSKE